MQQYNQDALFREIDEDLQRERWARLWKRYNRVVLGAIALAAIAVIAFTWWREHQRDRLAADAERYATAVAVSESDKPAALADFGAIVKDGSGGYALLSQFREAALADAIGERAAARDSLATVAGSDRERVYRDLAVIVDAAQRLNAPGAVIDINDIENRLAAAAGPDAPLRPMAQELIAAANLIGGNLPRAKEVLTTLINDPVVPPPSRAVASELLAAISAQ